MIKIKTDRRKYVEISGHAGYAPRGQDIVCAGISALYLTLCEALEDLPHSTVSVSSTSIYVKETEYPELTADLIRVFTKGMMLLAAQYPKNINFEWVDN